LDADSGGGHGNAEKKELLSLAEKEPLDERVSQEVMRLFDADNWPVMKGKGK
jgi:hypothetical protein